MPPTVRPPLIRLALPALLACGVGTPTALAQPALPQATTLRLLTPFQPDSTLSIGMAIAGQIRGGCFAASVASPTRPDAYRCSAGNAILDPCFVSLNDRQPLACARDPWSATVTRLTLTQPLPSSTSTTEPDYARTSPWALELANGQRCTRLTGATAPIAGLRVNYGCPDGALVAGELDRSGPVWRVFFQTKNRSLSLTQVEVTTAWY